MGWEVLPFDMETVILGKLSVVELARVSGVCHSFHAFSCSRLAKDEAALGRLAIKSLGLRRLKSIGLLIDGFLQRKLPPTDPLDMWMFPDGSLHVNNKNVAQCKRCLKVRELGIEHLVRVNIQIRPYYISITMHPRGRSANGLWVLLEINLLDKIARITVDPSGVEDMELRALVQDMMTWGVRARLQNAGVSLEIRMEGKYTRVGDRWAAMQAVIAPLLHMVTQCTLTSRRDEKDITRILRLLPSPASKGVTLFVRDM